MHTAETNRYLATLDRRFMASGVDLLSEIQWGPYCLRRVYRRTRFDLVAVPMFLEEHFVVSEAPAIDYDALLGYSAVCFEYVSANRMPNKPWKRFIGLNLFIYAVVVVDAADADLAEAIAKSLPVNHLSPGAEVLGFSDGIEIPVVYETTPNKLHYFQKVPVLGNAHHREMKKVAQKWLSP